MDDTLDFKRFGDSSVYVGRANGVAARKRFRVDRYDAENGEVTVVIPTDTYSLNSSFFLGLFGLSLKRFGSKERFLAHYKFDAPEHVMSTLESVLDTAYKSRGALVLEE
jgi:hypothetical protein